MATAARSKDADKKPATAKDKDTESEAMKDATPQQRSAAIQPVDPASAPVQVTYEDAMGVERLQSPIDPNWEPAPVDPDPVAVERGKEFEKRQKEARDKAEQRIKDVVKEQKGDTDGK